MLFRAKKQIAKNVIGTGIGLALLNFPYVRDCFSSAALTALCFSLDWLLDWFGTDLERFYNILSRYVKNRRVLRKAWEMVEVERESQLQKTRRDFQFLRYITEKKGGTAGEFMMLLYDPNASEEMLRLAHDLGYVAQLMDDYVDMYLDTLQGIHTLFTEGYYTYDDLVREVYSFVEKWKRYLTPAFRRAVPIVLKMGEFKELFKFFTYMVGNVMFPLPVLPLAIYRLIRLSRNSSYESKTENTGNINSIN